MPLYPLIVGFINSLAIMFYRAGASVLLLRFHCCLPTSRQRCVAVSVGLPIDGCPVFRNALCYDPCTPLAPCF